MFYELCHGVASGIIYDSTDGTYGLVHYSVLKDYKEACGDMLRIGDMLRYSGKSLYVSTDTFSGIVSIEYTEYIKGGRSYRFCLKHDLRSRCRLVYYGTDAVVCDVSNINTLSFIMPCSSGVVVVDEYGILYEVSFDSLDIRYSKESDGSDIRRNSLVNRNIIVL